MFRENSRARLLLESINQIPKNQLLPYSQNVMVPRADARLQEQDVALGVFLI